MKYIKKYRIFEEAELSEYDNLMGRILHLYSSIPLPKEKSSVVIHKIVKASGNDFHLGDDVDDIISFKLHDKIRFKDYYDSLIHSKDSRGHNFEGLVVGLFGGELNTRGSKADATIDGQRLSIKFIDNPSKAPELGSYREAFYPKKLDGNATSEQIEYEEYKSIMNEYVIKLGGLTHIFKKNNNKKVDKTITYGVLKERIWNMISIGVDTWLIAYPEGNDITYNLISRELMKEMLMAGMVAAPKAGYKSLYTLALSASFKSKTKKSYIRIPQINLNDLRNLMAINSDINWALDVFGNIAYKMRPDVIRSIKNNKHKIIKRLSEM